MPILRGIGMRSFVANGQGVRLDSMVNASELLINTVNTRQAKDADRLEPKGTVAGRGYFAGPLVDIQRHRRIEQT
jgi:hypothetical protein